MIGKGDDHSRANMFTINDVRKVSMTSTSFGRMERSAKKLVEHA